MNITAQAFTPARIAALAVATLMVVVLGYLRLSTGEEPASVPAGANAGELTTLQACNFATEDGPIAAQCGTLVVPENRVDPDSGLIALPVTRIPAQSDRPAEPLFYLEGGPGISNMSFPQVRGFAQDRDLVLVGYRGVDGSVRLDCPEVGSAVARSTDFFGEESYRAYGEAYRDCAERLSDEGVDLAGYGLPQEIDDIEAARTALGYDQIDLLSQSAGTRTALIYAWRFPHSIHRSVMVGANPPGHFLWDPATADEQIGRFADYCAKDTSCSDRTEDLAASMDRTSADMPRRWGPLPVNPGNVRLLTFYGLMETTSEAGPMAAPWALDSWLAADDGDPSGFWLQSFLGELMPIPLVWGQYAAGGSLDAQAAKDYFTRDIDRTNLGYVGSAFAWGGGRMADDWPDHPDAAKYSDMRPSTVETLLIGGELDFSTPPQGATKELLPFLPNGQQAVLPGFGHTLTFFSDQQDAGQHLVNTFLDTGRVDTSLYETQPVDFTPTGTLPSLAKGLVVVMLGLIVLAVSMMLWLGIRVRRRGRLGTPASALSRALGPVVVGAGGWVLGTLLAYTFIPMMPLAGPLLTTISVGVPVALVVHLAWLNRDAPLVTRRVGFAVAQASGLVGAWLGFYAVDGILAPVTAIVGAGVGANVALLVLDALRERSSTPRVPHANVPLPRSASAS